MQLLIHLPDPLGDRLKEAVPDQEQSAFVRRLIEDALPLESDPLYRIALQAERESVLDPDLMLWEQTVGDGLDFP